MLNQPKENCISRLCIQVPCLELNVLSDTVERSFILYVAQTHYPMMSFKFDFCNMTIVVVRNHLLLWCSRSLYPCI